MAVSYGTSGADRLIGVTAGVTTGLAAADSIGATLVGITWTTTGSHTIAVADNVATAFKVAQSTNDYFVVNTSNGTEALVFGHTGGTNPTMDFLGTGIKTMAGRLDLPSGNLTILADNRHIMVGAGPGGLVGDIDIYHDGTNSIFDNNTGNLLMLLSGAGGASYLKVQNNAGTDRFTVADNGDVYVKGNLTVDGTTTTVHSEEVNIADNHLFLNYGFTTNSTETGGLIVNYNPTATATTVAATGFVAGSATATAITGTVTGTFGPPTPVLTGSGTAFTTELAPGYTIVIDPAGIAESHVVLSITSDTVLTLTAVFTADFSGGGYAVNAARNPTVTTVGAATFAPNGTTPFPAAGDLIQISGASNVNNNGLFEVLYHAGNKLRIRGIGNVSTLTDYTQNDFTTDTTVQGALTKVNVSILRAGLGGDWEVGKGNNTSITFAALGVSGGSGWSRDIGNAQVYLSTDTDEVTVGANPGADPGTAKLAVLGNTASIPTLHVKAASGQSTDVILVEQFGGTDILTLSNGGNLFANGTITSGATITIDGVSSPRTISASAGGLTISTATSGAMALSAVGTFDIQAALALTIDTASGQTLGIGTDAVAQSITVGNNTGATALTMNAGSGNIGIGTNTIAQTIGIGTGVAARTINIGTAAAVQTVTVGSTDTTSSMVINSGTGNIDIGVSASARAINIGTGAAVVETIAIGGTGANVITVGNTQTGGSFSLGAAMTTGTINVGGTGLQTGTIDIGVGTGAQALNIGTGGTGVKTIAIGGTAANVITVGNTQTAGSLSLGAAMTTGTINVGGTGAQTGTIGIGTGTGAQALDIGTGGTGVKTISIGGTAANVIAIGNTQTAGSFSVGAAMTAGTINVGGTGAQTGTIDIGVGTGAQALNIGTGAAAKVITIGNAASASMALDAGVGGFTVLADTILDLDSGGALSLNSSGAAINVGNDTVAQGINIGTSGARTIAVGSATATTVNLDGLAFSIDATTTSNVTVTGGPLTVSTASSGALTLTSAAAATWSTSGGALTVGSAAALNLGTVAATSVNVAKTAVITDILGPAQAEEGLWLPDDQKVKYGGATAATPRVTSYGNAAGHWFAHAEAGDGTAYITTNSNLFVGGEFNDFMMPLTNVGQLDSGIFLFTKAGHVSATLQGLNHEMVNTAGMPRSAGSEYVGAKIRLTPKTTAVISGLSDIAGTTTLTGTGTFFTTQVGVGDTIIFDPAGTPQPRVVATITSNTVLDVTVAWTGTVTGKTVERQSDDVAAIYKGMTLEMGNTTGVSTGITVGSNWDTGLLVNSGGVQIPSGGGGAWLGTGEKVKYGNTAAAPNFTSYYSSTLAFGSPGFALAEDTAGVGATPVLTNAHLFVMGYTGDYYLPLTGVNPGTDNGIMLLAKSGDLTGSATLRGIQTEISNTLGRARASGSEIAAIAVSLRPKTTALVATGTNAAINNSTTLTGTGTTFLNDLAVGDSIVFDPSGSPQPRVIATITSNTVLDVTVAFTGGALTGDLQRVGDNAAATYKGLILEMLNTTGVSTGIDLSNNWDVGINLASGGILMPAQKLGLTSSEIGDIYVGANSGIRFKEGTAPTTGFAADTGWVYTKDVSLITELFYMNGAGTEVQITSGSVLNVTVSLDQAYNGGSSITVDAGAVTMTSATHTCLDLNLSTITDLPALNIDLTGANTNNSALKVLYGGSTINKATDVVAIDLSGQANTGAGDSVGIYAVGFDYAMHLPGGQKIALGNAKNFQLSNDGSRGIITTTDGLRLDSLDTTQGGPITLKTLASGLLGMRQGIIATGTAGEVMYVNGADTFAKAQGDVIGTAQVAGILINSPTGAEAEIAIPGSICHIAGSFAGSDVGKVVYLSAATAGLGTTVAPSGTGNVVFKLGILVTDDEGGGAGARLLYMPQFITVLP